MKAKIGDEIVVDAVHTGEPCREGKILEVIDRGGVVDYQLRWHNGRQTTFYPGSTTHVVRTGRTADTD